MVIWLTPHPSTVHDHVVYGFPPRSSQGDPKKTLLYAFFWVSFYALPFTASSMPNYLACHLKPLIITGAYVVTW